MFLLWHHKYKNGSIDKILLFLYFIFIVIGCKEKSSDPVLDGFKKTKRIHYFPSRIHSEELGDVFDILIIDSLLITNNRHDKNVLTFHNINTGDNFSRIGRGRGPSELLQPQLLHRYSDSLFFTIDIGSKKLVIFSVHGLINDNFSPVRSITINNGTLRASFINDSLIVCTGIYEDAEFYLIDTKTNELLSKNDFAAINGLEGIETYTKGLLLQGEIAIRPCEKDRFVKIYHAAGIITLCSIDNLEINNLISKIFFIPEFGLRGKFPVFSQETRFAYHSIQSTEDFFYTVFSGGTRSEKGSNFASGSNLLVYNWDGEPIINYVLDRDIYRMTIDLNKNIAYGLSKNPETSASEIVCYELPEIK